MLNCLVLSGLVWSGCMLFVVVVTLVLIVAVVMRVAVVMVVVVVNC